VRTFGAEPRQSEELTSKGSGSRCSPS
jgi:hypothetical protein